MERIRALAPVLAVPAVLTVLLAGCGGQPARTPSTASSTAAPAAGGPGVAPDDGGVYPLLPATHPHVQLTCPLEPAVHLDAAQISEVDAAYVCTAEPWTPAPDGTPQLVQYVDRIAPADVGALLEAYATPDAERSDGPCDLAMHDPLVVWLHASEQITAVYAPRDPCGHPTEAAEAAYRAADLERLLVAREKERT